MGGVPPENGPIFSGGEWLYKQLMDGGPAETYFADLVTIGPLHPPGCVPAPDDES